MEDHTNAHPGPSVADLQEAVQAALDARGADIRDAFGDTARAFEVVRGVLMDMELRIRALESKEGGKK